MCVEVRITSGGISFNREASGVAVVSPEGRKVTLFVGTEEQRNSLQSFGRVRVACVRSLSPGSLIQFNETGYTEPERAGFKRDHQPNLQVVAIQDIVERDSLHLRIASHGDHFFLLH